MESACYALFLDRIKVSAHETPSVVVVVDPVPRFDRDDVGLRPLERERGFALAVGDERGRERANDEREQEATVALELVAAFVLAHRHLDLARAAVALALRFGPAVVAPFLDAYGLDDIDVRRLDTCQLLGSVAEEVGVAEPVDAP